MKDDLDFLVQETMNLASTIVGSNPFFMEKILPKGPGLIYNVEKGLSTFVVRMLEAGNISETMQMVEDSIQLRKLLRLNGEGPISAHFFETPNREVAQVIKDKIANKRFPLEEQTLCNLSDPGFNWWITHGPNVINISFKNYRLDDTGGYQSIGALGDPRLSAMKLNQCQGLLRELFPLGHFFCNENLFGVETTAANTLAFEKFKRLFLEGRDLEELFDLSKLHEKHHESLVFLREISFVRKFWRVLESELKN
ncbi:MAG: hypothetical protein ACOYL6_01750 [Bacteriovoracaceae bacterium]